MEEQKGSNRGREGVAWGLGGALVASLCCLGPVVALAMGLGGASFLFGLTAYRPYFLGFGFLLMGAGLFFTLRRSRACCTKEQHRRNLWLYPGLILVTFALSYSFLTYVLPGLAYKNVGEGVAPVLAGALEERNPSNSAEMQTPSQGLRLAVLEIEGMT